MGGHFANSWDEWVGADRLMKNTEENVLKQQELDKKQGVEKNSKSGRSAQMKPKSSAGKLCSFIQLKCRYHYSLLSQVQSFPEIYHIWHFIIIF